MLIRLGHLTVDIQPKHQYLVGLCRPYAAPADAVPDFSVAVSDEEIRREAACDPHATDDVREAAAVYRKLCRTALAYDTFLFHGSAVALDGVAYLFTAPSGTGKSTHTALWKRVFGDRAVIVNDDKPLLHVTSEGVTVCGTPWDGKHRRSTPGVFPLKAICILERGAENKVEPLAAKEAYPLLLGQTNRPANPAYMQTTLTLLDRAMEKLKFYKLTCNMSPDAARVACEGMGGLV